MSWFNHHPVFIKEHVVQKIHLGFQDKTYEKYTVHGNEDHSTQLNANGGVFKWCSNAPNDDPEEKGSWKGLKLQKWSEEGEMKRVVCCIYIYIYT